MKILYLGYWNASDPLTRATIYPQLKVLQELNFVSQIIFVNTERASDQPLFQPDFTVTKICYQPIFSANFRFNLFNKIADFLQFPRTIRKLISQFAVDVVIARGAPAGALAFLSVRGTTVPFIVESFEPHAEYMLESGVWKIYDPRYIFQKRWEQKQKLNARALLPVANNYREKLISEGVDPGKIITVPCPIQEDSFFFNEARRAFMRGKFELGNDDTVGIYAGKFGGLYMEDESFKLYEGAFHNVKNFFLILLSPPEYHQWIFDKIAKYRMPSARIHVDYVSHEAIPDYLSMSDFAFATYKPGKWKKYLCPVKVGEFWASGLPVILTHGIGDESGYLEDRTAGVLFDPDDINWEDLSSLFTRLRDLTGSPRIRKDIAALASETRSLSKAREAYTQLLSS